MRLMRLLLQISMSAQYNNTNKPFYFNIAKQLNVNIL